MELNETSFQEEVIESKQPVLVNFWASWCPPCKMMEPLMDQIALEYKGVLSVHKVNIDRSPLLAERYKIQSVPTFITFRQGVEEGRLVAAQTRGNLDKLLVPIIEGENRGD